MAQPDVDQATAGQLTVVAGEIASLFRERWGRGPRKTRAYWAGPDILVVLCENGHTEAEKTMRAAGHIQELLGGRHVLQLVVEEEMRGIVERVAGRKVGTVLSATRLDPDLSAEIFVMADEPHFQHLHGENAALLEGAVQVRQDARELVQESRALEAQNEQIQRARKRREAHTGD